jgi:hypothetical protein
VHCVVATIDDGRASEIWGQTNSNLSQNRTMRIERARSTCATHSRRAIGVDPEALSE